MVSKNCELMLFRDRKSYTAFWAAGIRAWGATGTKANNSSISPSPCSTWLLTLSLNQSFQPCHNWHFESDNTFYFFLQSCPVHCRVKAASLTFVYQMLKKVLWLWWQNVSLDVAKWSLRDHTVPGWEPLVYLELLPSLLVLSSSGYIHGRVWLSSLTQHLPAPAWVYHFIFPLEKKWSGSFVSDSLRPHGL